MRSAGSRGFARFAADGVLDELDAHAVIVREKFYAARKEALLGIVSQAMGKAATQTAEVVAEDADEEEEDV